MNILDSNSIYKVAMQAHHTLCWLGKYDKLNTFYVVYVTQIILNFPLYFKKIVIICYQMMCLEGQMNNDVVLIFKEMSSNEWDLKTNYF